MSDLKEEIDPQIAQMSADSENHLRKSAQSADRSRFRRIGWMLVELLLIVVVLGLITATVLPAIVGRSPKADQFGAQRPPRARPPVHSR